MLTIVCCSVVGLGLDLVSGWQVVMRTYCVTLGCNCHGPEVHTCCWCPEKRRAELEIAFLTFSSRELRLATVSRFGSSCAVLSSSTIARHSGRLRHTTARQQKCATTTNTPVSTATVEINHMR